MLSEFLEGSDMTNMKWHNRFSDLAELIATWSKDPSTKVGAVIVRERVVISTGYNGLPKRVEDISRRLDDRELKYPMTVHAELNAILQAETNLKDAHLYVTHHPCARCAGTIIQSGISKVFVRQGESTLNSNWDKEKQMAQDMFLEAGVVLVMFKKVEESFRIVAAE